MGFCSAVDFGLRSTAEAWLATPGNVKVLFATDALKRRMLLEEPHPFSNADVDVAVETIEGRPVLYKVLALHEVIER